LTSDLLEKDEAVLGPETCHVVPEERALDQPHPQQGTADGCNVSICVQIGNYIQLGLIIKDSVPVVHSHNYKKVKKLYKKLQ
jgi:hypothetical protein